MADRTLATLVDFGVFSVGRDFSGIDAAEDFYRQFGYVLLRDLLGPESIDRMEAECEEAQRQVLAGEVPDRYGAAQYLDDEAKIERFVNYVQQVQELSPAVREAAEHPVLLAVIRRLIGDQAWLYGPGKQGVVYQDARPGRESGYSRIGWHSDWQASPSLDIWPSTAFTIHIDPTSPANGFLRVVPGSHQWATPAPYRNVNNVEVPADAKSAGGYTDTPPPVDMPLGFEKVPGELAVYADRGDVILHDAYLWHSAARATDDTGVRRHVRSGYFSGDPTTTRSQFLKNAAR